MAKIDFEHSFNVQIMKNYPVIQQKYSYITIAN